MQSPAINPTQDMQQRIERFAGQVVTDLSAAMAGVMTNIGHKLGLYRAIAENGPMNSHELARITNTNERSVREWLNAQVAGGYVLFDTNTRQYSLPAEHALCWRIRIVPHFFRQPSTSRLPCGTVKTRSLPHSAPAREWAGTNTIAGSSPEPKPSFATDTAHTLRRRGYHRSADSISS